ncbi:MAG: hypothetical protein J0H57_11335, partial [Rhodospirillales bacterium]|nr:hypothetical protein [Rhodospirillales bacterium]
ASPRSAGSYAPRSNYAPQPQRDNYIGNLYASGEIMAGNILGRGYLAGFGMTIGTVFGRIAGQEAARHARN